MKQLSKEQAIAFHNSKVWEDMTLEQLAEFQLFQKLLCVPFGKFHEAIEHCLKRPVFTHEFGMDYDGLVKEFLGERPAPTFEDIVNMIPKEKRILITK